MEDLGHRIVGKEGSPLVILQATDLHHFPSGVTSFDVTAAKGRIVPLSQFQLGADVALLAAVIARAAPDVVMLTGDIIDGRPFGKSSAASASVSASESDIGASAWKGALCEVLDPIVAAGCHWSFTPGNHDDDGSPWSRRALLEMFDPEACFAVPNSGGSERGKRARGDAIDGDGGGDSWAKRCAALCLSRGATSWDHTLTVGPTQAPCGKSSVRLWLFDSGGNDPDPGRRYGTVSPAAVSGFRALVGLPPATLPGPASQSSVASGGTVSRSSAAEAMAAPLTPLPSPSPSPPTPAAAAAAAAAAATASAAAAAAPLGPSALGLAFFHIPLPQVGGAAPSHGHEGLFDAALVGGLVPLPWRWAPGLVKGLGRHRVVGCSKAPDTGLFAALAASLRLPPAIPAPKAAKAAALDPGQATGQGKEKRGGGRGVGEGGGGGGEGEEEAAACGSFGVAAAFFGHDHFNDFVLVREGLALCYGRVGGYTPPVTWEGDGGKLPFNEGCRAVRFDVSRGGRLDTWVEEAAGADPTSLFVIRPGSG